MKTASGRLIVGLSGSAPYCELRLAVTFAEGGALVEPRSERAPLSFGDDLQQPVAALTHGGALVAATAKEGRIYDVVDGQLLCRRSFEGPGTPPIAAVPTAGADRFAVFTYDGRVCLYSAR
jgi:hypothetical protein